MVGESGKVFAFEIIPELAEFGKVNVAKYNFIEKRVVEFFCADGSKGYQKEAPYDKILCSATVQGVIPKAWKDQLKEGGRIVTPVSQSIWLLTKKSDNVFEEIEYPGFVFVPLIEMGN
jgi:protein-L-isoaspartate(D-aspartate) O-methyltransferase